MGGCGGENAWGMSTFALGGGDWSPRHLAGVTGHGAGSAHLDSRVGYDMWL